MSLVLLGQAEMVKRNDGMLVAFIDFSKVYDKVDRDRLWSCLQSGGEGEVFMLSAGVV